MNLLNTINVLFDYAMLYKRKFLLAFFILLVSTLCLVSGPVIIKKIIDDHINGVTNYSWYMTESEQNLSKKNIKYNGLFFIREDWVDVPEDTWIKVNIQQTNNQYSVVNNDSQVLLIDSIRPFYQHEFKAIILYIGIYLALILLGNLLRVVQEYSFNSAAIDVTKKIRLDLFNKIHKISFKVIDQTTSGQIITQLSHDTEEIKRLMINFISTYVVNIVTIIGIYIFMFMLDFKLALFALLILPFYFIAAFLHVKYSKKFVSQVRNRVASLNTVFNETIRGITIIKALKSEKKFQDRFDITNNERYSFNLKQIQVEKLSGWNIVDLLKTLFLAFTVWYFGSQVLTTEGIISIGVIYAFIDYISRLVNPMVNMLEQLSVIQRALVSSEQSLVLLYRESDTDGETTKSKQTFQKGDITFKDVCFSYDNKQEILKSVSFDIKTGEKVAIVGRTGSGKSTIINLLLKFYQLEKGDIKINGISLKEYSKKELRENIGYVSQDSHIFSGNIFFNIGLYSNMENYDKVIKAAKTVGADDFINELPEGYHTVLSEQGSEISSGQKQLITFARAIINNPPILLLDEATAKIDSQSEEDLNKALDKMTSGRTTLIIAHRLNTVKNCDKIIVIDNGEIVEVGRHTELINRKGHYYNLNTFQSLSKDFLST